MKITYTFCDETIEIEVTDNWGHVVVDLNRHDYNINHKETRRHISLDAFESEPIEFSDKQDLIAEFIEGETLEERLPMAIAQLEPQQQELIHKVFFKGRKKSDIAAEEGVSPAAITDRLSKIYRKLKKFLS